jgi:hypothetical protein
MSIRCWLYALTLGGCLITGSLSAHAIDHHPEQASSGQREEAPNTANDGARGQQANTQEQPAAISHERCQKARHDGVILDECQQFNMAIAAKRQADATDELLGITKLEIGLLVGTFLLSGIATIAAVCAVQITSNTSKAQLRAYVVVTDITLTNADNEYVPIIEAILKNTGQTPAYNARIRLKYSAMLNGREAFDLSGIKFNNLTDIGPGMPIYRTVEINPRQWELISAHLKTDEYTLYVFGECTYTDAFKKRHTTEFRFNLPMPNGVIEDGSLAISPDGNRSD